MLNRFICLLGLTFRKLKTHNKHTPFCEIHISIDMYVYFYTISIVCIVIIYNRIHCLLTCLNKALFCILLWSNWYFYVIKLVHNPLFHIHCSLMSFLTVASSIIYPFVLIIAVTLSRKMLLTHIKSTAKGKAIYMHAKLKITCIYSWTYYKLAL